MDQNSSIEEYSFQSELLEERGYRVFSDELENERYVCFHGTAEESLQSIIEYGFRIGGKLPSVSFAKTSPVALKYACDGRADDSKKGCIMAVRFNNFDDVVEEESVVHVYRNDRMPTVVGYCIIPASYKFQ